MPGSLARCDQQDSVHEGWLAGRPALWCGAEPLQAVARGAQARVDLERLAEISDRALDVAEPHPGLAAIVPRISIGRVVLQRLVVVGKAAFVVALVEPDHAAIAPAARIGRRDPGRLAVVGCRTVE